MKKHNNDLLGWSISITILIGFIIGWLSNNAYYNSKPTTLELKKHQYIEAQKECGFNNVTTITDGYGAFKRFECDSWSEATKSGETK